MRLDRGCALERAAHRTSRRSPGWLPYRSCTVRKAVRQESRCATGRPRREPFEGCYHEVVIFV